MTSWRDQINKHTPVKIAAELHNIPNGQCPPALLRDVFGGKGTRIGRLPHQAARSWAAMVAAALAAGVPPAEITATDTYRDLPTQKRLIAERYTASPLPGSKSSRVCDGKRIYLRPGMATAACAGHSNHGGQGAVDKGDGPDFHAWLEVNALRFGWEWELPSEKWHLHYFAGDDIPAAVLAFEAGHHVPKEDDMLTFILSTDGVVLLHAGKLVHVDTIPAIDTDQNQWDLRNEPKTWAGIKKAYGPIVSG